MSYGESDSGHIVVFGCHGVARRVIKQLAKGGHRVHVVDPDATAIDQDDMRRWDVEYVSGWSQRESTLRAAGVADASAVVCLYDDDLRNIEVALLVRELSPTVRVVLQVANVPVGRAIAGTVQPGTVLDIASLASQSFLELVARKPAHRLELAGTEFIVTTFDSDHTSIISDQFAELAPIAVTGDGEPLRPCPGREETVHAGARVTVIGTAADYSRAGRSIPMSEQTLKPPTAFARLRERFAALRDAIDRPFRVAFAVLAGLSLISVIILMLFYREPDGTTMNFLDAIYFTLETIGTVGFGDFYFRDQDAWLRIWAIILILFGVTLVAVVTALLTNTLVTRRLASSLGRQRLTAMKDHVIVIGLGSVGARIVTDLRADGLEVAIIDRDERNRYLPQMRSLGASVLVGDATLPGTLHDAGIDRAAGVAVVTSDDLVNIDTGLAVRAITGERELPTALRIFERDLARVLGTSLDAGQARSTAELATPWFVGAALGLDVLATFYAEDTPFMAARLLVRANSGLDGVMMQEIGEHTRTVAIRRKGSTLETLPRKDARVHAGDELFIIGQYQDLLAVLQRA